jgi:hypothetical protein
MAWGLPNAYERCLMEWGLPKYVYAAAQRFQVPLSEAAAIVDIRQPATDAEIDEQLVEHGGMDDAERARACTWLARLEACE